MAAAIEVTDTIDEVEGIPETDSSIDIDYSRAWSRLGKAFGKHQMRILQYITKKYMYQWAKCSIDHYRDFGQRVNSPV
ncbi:hypothetical protein E4U59_007554 [Claviceps monticola]|nr:hypothetical protein E4U59_007554 [Claviceps monticola]